MAPRLRRMKVYRPRKRMKRIGSNRQMLKDLEHRISSALSSLLILLEEGNTQQIEAAKLKVKSNYLKHSNEMEKIAVEMGEKYTQAVRAFLDSVDTIVHSSPGWIDNEKIRHCYKMTQQLEKEIGAA